MMKIILVMVPESELLKIKNTSLQYHGEKLVETIDRLMLENKGLEADEQNKTERLCISKNVTGNDIEEIKVRMDNLNACIIDEYESENLSTKDKIGLTKAYQIGASYFLKYAMYNNFDELWENHIEGLLYEYLRGTSNIEVKIERLKKAYNDTVAH